MANEWIGLLPQAPAPVQQLRPDQMLSMQQMQLRIDELRRQQASQNALRGLFSDESALDPKTGLPTQNALRDIWRIDPQVGLDVTRAIPQIAGQVTLNNYRQSQVAEQTQADLRKAMGDAYSFQQELVQQGVPPQQAEARARDQFGETVRQMRSSGRIAPEQQIPAYSTAAGAGVSITPEQRTQNEQAAVRQRRERFSEPQRITIAGDDGKDRDVFARYDKDNDTYVTVGGRTETIDPKNVRKIGTKDESADANAALSPEALKTSAEQYLAGDRTVMQNVGRGNQGSKNLVALRSEIARQAAERGMSGADIAATLAQYDGMKAGMRTLGTRTANIEMAVNEAQQLAPLVLDASGKVNRTQFPLLNNVLQAGERGTGDEDVVRFGIAVNSLINTYARAINPTGVSRVSDIEHARELLSTAWSKGQINAGVDQLMKEMDAARRSPGMVREEMRGAISGERQVPGSPSGAPAATAKVPPKAAAAADLPEAARSALSEGQVTTFGNGQSWTLRNGKPERVN